MKYGLILLMVLSSSILLAQTVSPWGYEDDGKIYKITEVTSADGAMVNIQYSKSLVGKYGLVLYVITCETKQHRLCGVLTEMYLFQLPKKYTLILEKIKEFEKVTAYRFVFQYDPDDEDNLNIWTFPQTRKFKRDIEMIVWLDNADNEDNYCGSFNPGKYWNYRQIYDENLAKMREMSAKEYYDSVSDVYIYFIEDEIEKASEHLKEYGDSKSYTFKYSRDILDVIKKYDPDRAERYVKEINELREKGDFYDTSYNLFEGMNNDDSYEWAHRI